VVGLDAAAACNSASAGCGAVRGSFPVTFGLGGGFGGGAVVGSVKKATTSSMVGSPCGAATPFASTLTGETMACGGAMALKLYGIVGWGVGKGLVWFGRWRWVGRLSFL
jgi:hypothetical protein